MNKFMLTPQDAEILSAILAPVPYPIYVYGSRAKGTAQRFSDIDLYIDGPLSDLLLAHLHTQCEESSLSIKVDLLTHSQISPEFLNTIRADFMVYTATVNT